MRKLFILLAAALLAATAWSQSPEKMSYQAVVRDASGNLIANGTVGVRIQILQASEFGAAVYVETHSTTTNVNGLVTLEIGGGTIVLGAFDIINWANGPYFIKTETDPTGGTSYSITGVSQILSVPYALHAKTVESAPAHYIGESYGGGIVFWVDATRQHGLIAATEDQSTGIQWYNGTYRYTGSTGDGVGAGVMNTAMIVGTQITDNQTGNFASKVCADYSTTVGGVTYGDWYLPSTFELNLLYLQKNVVGGFGSVYYWSSTELSDEFVNYQHFLSGYQFFTTKGNTTTYVRSIRAF